MASIFNPRPKSSDYDYTKGSKKYKGPKADIKTQQGILIFNDSHQSGYSDVIG